MLRLLILSLLVQLSFASKIEFVGTSSYDGGECLLTYKTDRAWRYDFYFKGEGKFIQANDVRDFEIDLLEEGKKLYRTNVFRTKYFFDFKDKLNKEHIIIEVQGSIRTPKGFKITKTKKKGLSREMVYEVECL